MLNSLVYNSLTSLKPFLNYVCFFPFQKINKKNYFKQSLFLFPLMLLEGESNAYIYIHTHACIHINIHTNIHMHIRTYIHYIRTYIHYILQLEFLYSTEINTYNLFRENKTARRPTKAYKICCQQPTVVMVVFRVHTLPTTCFTSLSKFIRRQDVVIIYSLSTYVAVSICEGIFVKC